MTPLLACDADADARAFTAPRDSCCAASSTLHLHITRWIDAQLRQQLLHHLRHSRRHVAITDAVRQLQQQRITWQLQAARGAACCCQVLRQASHQVGRVEPPGRQLRHNTCASDHSNGKQAARSSGHNTCVTAAHAQCLPCLCQPAARTLVDGVCCLCDGAAGACAVQALEVHAGQQPGSQRSRQRPARAHWWQLVGVTHQHQRRIMPATTASPQGRAALSQPPHS